MARLMGLTDTEAQKTITGYSYSSVPMDEIKDWEYTIVKIAIDKSSSVAEFKDDLEKMIKNCIEACKLNAREESILVSIEAFSSDLEEIHGFVRLTDINPDNYAGTIEPGGMTALYDATLSAVESVKQYGESLVKKDNLCNAIIFIITDGGENDSSKAKGAAGLKKIRKAIADIKKDELLESVRVLLIGVGDEEDVKDYLDQFQKDIGIDQFEWAGQATPKVLHKIGQFMSESVSSQSQSLGSGKPSQKLTVTF